MEKSMSPPFSLPAMRGSADHPHGREMHGLAPVLCMRGMQLDEMIDREDRERQPHRGRGGRAHFHHGEADEAEREDDLQVDRVVARELDLAVELFYEIDHDARA